MSDAEMTILTVQITTDDMDRLNRVTARKAPDLGLMANRARSVLIRQMLAEYLNKAEAELGLSREPLAAA
jgi:hypothetical protein